MSEVTFKFVFEGLSKTAAKMVSRQVNDWFVEGKLGSANSWMEEEHNCEDEEVFGPKCKECGELENICVCIGTDLGTDEEDE